MRIRLLGHQFPLSIAMLAMIEAAAVFFGLVVAEFLRFRWDVNATNYSQGPMWARALLFAAQ